MVAPPYHPKDDTVKELATAIYLQIRFQQMNARFAKYGGHISNRRKFTISLGYPVARVNACDIAIAQRKFAKRHHGIVSG